MQGCLVIILIIVVWKIGGCAVDQFTEWRDEKAKQVEQEKAREEALSFLKDYAQTDIENMNEVTSILSK